MPKAFIIDYGCGNITSLKSWFNSVSIKSAIIETKEDFSYLNNDSLIVLPGVGHFGKAIKSLDRKGFRTKLEEIKGKIPILGICLGSQILLEKSEEAPAEKGLGFIQGQTVCLPINESPRTGWYKTNLISNKLNGKNKYLNRFNSFYYYNHSFVQKISDNQKVMTLISNNYCAGYFDNDLIVGLQFHPEKSQKAGKIALKSILKFFSLL